MIAFFKLLPELLALIKPLLKAFQDHKKSVVKAEIEATFKRLEEAKSEEDKRAALRDVNSL